MSVYSDYHTHQLNKNEIKNNCLFALTLPTTGQLTNNSQKLQERFKTKQKLNMHRFLTFSKMIALTNRPLGVPFATIMSDT